MLHIRPGFPKQNGKTRQKTSVISQLWGPGHAKAVSQWLLPPGSSLKEWANNEAGNKKIEKESISIEAGPERAMALGPLGLCQLEFKVTDCSRERHSHACGARQPGVCTAEQTTQHTQLMPTWAIASFSGPDVASEVYLLTDFHKEMGILTGLWLHMTVGLCLMVTIVGGKLQKAFRPPAGKFKV